MTAQKIQENKRPLSPHLQVYKWEITMFMSILHRASGVALAVGALFFTVWLLTTIKGGAAFTMFYDFAKTPVGILISFLWLWAFVLHFLNGIRHLIWDAGYGFGLKAAHLGAWLVLIGSFILTTIIWNAARFAA